MIPYVSRWDGSTWTIPWSHNFSSGVLLDQFDQLMTLLNSIRFPSNFESWRCSMGVIHSWLRRLDFVWNRYLPIKINIFIWRVIINRLPTTCNLDGRGVYLKSLLCMCSEEEQEDGNHIFFECSIAPRLWLNLAKWVYQQIPTFSSVTDLMHWIDGLKHLVFIRRGGHCNIPKFPKNLIFSKQIIY